MTTSTVSPFALGLGANLGAAKATLRHAIEQLSEILGPLAVGDLYRTLPHSSIPQPAFLNTAVAGTTDRSARDLLELAKELEVRAGRRPGPRNAPRELDIDLLVYGCTVSSLPELILPHPRLRERRFALAPLADIAPETRLPPDGATVAELLARVGQEDEVERIGW